MSPGSDRLVDEHNFAKHGDSLARGFPVNTTGWRAKVVRGLLQRSQCTEMHMDKRCRYMQQAMQHAMSTSTDNTQLHKTSVQNCLFDQRRNVRQALQQLHSKGAQQWYTAMVRSGIFLACATSGKFQLASGTEAARQISQVASTTECGRAASHLLLSRSVARSGAGPLSSPCTEPGVQTLSRWNHGLGAAEKSSCAPRCGCLIMQQASHNAAGIKAGARQLRN